MKFAKKFVIQRAWNMKFAWNLMNIWNIDVILLSDRHLASVNPTQSYTRLSLCVCACAKCTLKLCVVMYNYALNLCVWSLTLTYFIVKNFSSDTPRDENILPRTTFTRKYPTVNFSQTMVHAENASDSAIWLYRLVYKLERLNFNSITTKLINCWYRLKHLMHLQMMTIDQPS